MKYSIDDYNNLGNIGHAMVTAVLSMYWLGKKLSKHIRQ